jgi:hypothetical protein
MTAQSTIEWASPKQRECFVYGPMGGGEGIGGPLCASGGFGAAKTFAFCLKGLWLSDVFPKNRGLIARKVGRDLFDSTLPTFYKNCPPEAYNKGRRADSEGYLRLNNGSEILFRHMDSVETENIIKGIEINWFLLDQAEEMDEELFDRLMARLGRWDKAEVPDFIINNNGGLSKWAYKNPQTGKPVVPNYALLTCNPDHELHWIYRRFHPDSSEFSEVKIPVVGNDGVETGELTSYKKMGYLMVQMSSRENKFLSHQNLQIMLSKDKSFVDRFVDGKWGMSEGAIHNVDPMSIIPGDRYTLESLLRSCRLGMTLDHGDAAPTVCCWWATDRNGNEVCLGEYYMPNKLISQHRKAITELKEGVFRGDYGEMLADPSIHYKTQQKHGGRWSVYDEYADCTNLPRETALFWNPADNNELGTRNRISEYLQVDPERIHPFFKTKGSPRIFFLKKNDDYPFGCDHTLTQLRSQRRKKIGTELGRPVFSDDRDDSIPDHAYDCVRYRIASRPPLAPIATRTYSSRSFAGIRASAIGFKRKRGWQRLARQIQG